MHVAATFISKKGLKIFGEKGYDAIMKEMGQLDDREAFRPIHVSELTTNERKKGSNSFSLSNGESEMEQLKGEPYIMAKQHENG